MAAIHDDWESHLVVLRHIVRGRWDSMREMSLHQHESDDSFCNLVIGQHLTRLVVGRLAADEQAVVLPWRWMETLRAEVMRSRESRDRLKRTLAQVCGVLSEAGIDHRVLKGLPFAQRYYGDINLRRSVDIDLLVHPQDVNRVVELLSGGPAIKKRTLCKQHELNLEHGGIEIDLHWRFRTAPAYQWRDSDIWAQKDVVGIEGANYPVLPDEYALSLLLVSTAHDIARGGCRLKHFLDVHQLLCCDKTNIDWPGFLENRRAENTLRIAVNMLMMVLDLWAEEGELAQLRAALTPYARLLPSDAGIVRSLELVRSPRGGVENKLWFAKVYGVRWRRDAAWIVARSVPHPGRWPLAISRIVQFSGKKLRGLLMESSK